jgi:CBS domain containing-hemolysin-like protein
MNTVLILGVAISLFFSFFFMCFEVAYLMANKSAIKEDADEGGFNARILEFFFQKPAWLLGSIRVGYCTSLVFFNYFMAQLLLPIVDNALPSSSSHTFLIILIQIIFSSILILLIAQFLSKVFGNIFPERMLRLSALPFGVLSLILFPLTYCVFFISKFAAKNLLNLEYDDLNPRFGITNLNQHFKNIYNVKHENVNLELDKKILKNALEFKSVKVRECMIPRNEITGIDISGGLQKLQQIFVESGHSKIIIYRNTIDDIIGYCHSSSLFTQPASIENILTPVITVHETSLASDLMLQFLNERKSLAVVMDEFGGTAGIVSREDVIEEIFGEIEDEHDEDLLTEQKLDGFTYLLSARLEIDYLNEKYNWQLPIGEYKTLGGLILAFAEYLPKPGETVTIGPYTFAIQAAQGSRIDTIKMTLEPAHEEL